MGITGNCGINYLPSVDFFVLLVIPVVINAHIDIRSLASHYTIH